MSDFAKNSYWDCKEKKFFDCYVDNGYKFYGKGKGEDRLLKAVKDGEVVGPYDIHVRRIAESFDYLIEDIQSSLPVQPLNRDELYHAIDEVKPGTYVHAGYFNDVTSRYLAAKYTGGRGSEGNPFVKLFKATEIYGRCGIDHEEIQAIKDRRAAGIERQGNRYEIESELGNKIFHIPSTGKDVLQIYPRSKADVKSRYFISVDNEDLRPATREELTQYCKPSAIAPSNKEFDPASPMRWDLTKIYWFKNLGHSII